MDKDFVVSSSDVCWEVTEEENPVCNKACYWCEQRPCARKKVGHVWCSCEPCIREYATERWRATYDRNPEVETNEEHEWNPNYEVSTSEGQSGLRRRPVPREEEANVPERNRSGTARRRGRAAVEGTIGQGVQESTYEDHGDTNTNNAPGGRIRKNRVQWARDDLGRDGKTALTGCSARALRGVPKEPARGKPRRLRGGESRNARHHGGRYDGTSVVLKVRPTSWTSRMPRSECRQSFTKLTRHSEKETDPASVLRPNEMCGCT